MGGFSNFLLFPVDVIRESWHIQIIRETKIKEYKMGNGYYQVRFNLSYYEANDRILREVNKYKKELLSQGINDIDEKISNKVKELEEFWLTWIEY